MYRAATPLLVVLAFACSIPARAADFYFQGYADFRLVVPGAEVGYVDGGLGKLRFGGGQPSPNLRFAEAVGQGTLVLSDELRFVVVGRIEPKQRSGIDLLESYAAWRPHVEGWLFSLKAGAFFPPFSLENTDLGWTSPYTLTPSALNSWIGDELRTIGVEGHVERQTSVGKFSLTGALFCCNDPAGVLIADRGWALDDRPSGLIEEVREPDATLTLFGATPPERTPLFLEIDHRVGWYAGASWSMAGIGKAALYRYDNNADPAAFQKDYFAWRTRFWSIGWDSHLGSLSILAQGLTGDTAIAPFPGFVATTKFKTAFLLAAYDFDAWRIAGRAEVFQTRDSAGAGLLDEDGHAFTVASSWMPKDWLRLSAELIAVTSRRDERTIEGLSAKQSDVQLQVGARFSI
jgi:hypothetical protein